MWVKISVPFFILTYYINIMNYFSSLIIDGVSITPGINNVIDVPFGTTSVIVNYVLDPASNVNVSILGNSNFVSGQNTLTIDVSDETGILDSFTQTINVLLSNDTSLASLTIDGIFMSLDKFIITSNNEIFPIDIIILPYGTQTINLDVLPKNVNASVNIKGNTELVVGLNNIDINVIAEDSVTITTYFLTVIVLDPDLSNRYFNDI